MNKVHLCQLSKELNGKLYVVSIYDLEPQGLIVNAYDQDSSKQYNLAVSEYDLYNSEVNRTKSSLMELIDTLVLTPRGDDFVLESTIPTITKEKERLLGDNLMNSLEKGMDNSSTSVNETLVHGLVELCKVKPVGVEAIKWLGEWLLANNPNKPSVSGNE